MFVNYYKKTIRTLLMNIWSEIYDAQKYKFLCHRKSNAMEMIVPLRNLLPVLFAVQRVPWYHHGYLRMIKGKKKKDTITGIGLDRTLWKYKTTRRRSMKRVDSLIANQMKRRELFRVARYTIPLLGNAWLKMT